MPNATDPQDSTTPPPVSGPATGVALPAPATSVPAPTPIQTLPAQGTYPSWWNDGPAILSRIIEIYNRDGLAAAQAAVDLANNLVKSLPPK